VTILQIHGLHPYVGFLHQLKNGHPALVSDLMEEWRPILVDSFVMHLRTGKHSNLMILYRQTEASICHMTR
jgi:CRISPR/Cas system-associated endonuclease Cas1